MLGCIELAECVSTLQHTHTELLMSAEIMDFFHQVFDGLKLASAVVRVSCVVD